MSCVSYETLRKDKEKVANLQIFSQKSVAFTIFRPIQHVAISMLCMAKEKAIEKVQIAYMPT